MDLVSHLAQSLPKKFFYLYTPYASAKYRKIISARKNVTLMETIFELIPIVDDAECLLTLGCSLHPQHKISLLFSNIFQHQGKPRFDIQHGLFQSGITLGNSDQKLAENTIMTDNIIKWSEYGIPLSRKHVRFSGKTILVTSNLHWKLYSDQDRSLFKRSVLAIARSFPEFDIVWRAHPAEFEYRAGALPRLPFGYPEAENLRYLTFQETEDHTAGENIQGSMLLFTSPSTAIVDAEQHGLPTVIFESAALRQALQGLKHVNCVRHPEETINAVADILSGRNKGLTESGLDFGFAAGKFAALLDSEIAARRADGKPPVETGKTLELFLEKASLFGVPAYE